MLSADQILNKVYDQTNQVLKTSGSGGGTQGVPVTLLTVSASDLNQPSWNYNYALKNVLNPLAKSRIFEFGGEGASGLDNYVNVSIIPFVSADPMFAVTDTGHVRMNATSGVNQQISNIDGGYAGIMNSDDETFLKGNFDSVLITIGTQATIPTKGEITVRLIELT